LPDGYQTLTTHLAKGLDILTGTTVTEVAWNLGGVSVTTNHGVIQADRVVITLPLGVLKANKVRFNPGLPAAKQKAIQVLGMGLLNKCFLRFPKVFWAADRDWLQSIGPVPGLWAEWVSYARPLGIPILVGFNAADVGREVETWSDRKTVDSAMVTLRRIYGSGIPDPVGYQITRWAADPFSLGSYSFNALGSRPGMRDDLAKSIDNRVFFAGEATDRNYFGTVHGAYLSGLRVAGEISAIA
jgi:monoamine oxidase